MAKLYFRYGAMNSGKSTGLLQTAYNYEERDQRVLLLKAVVDTKGEDSVVSRLGVSRRVDLLVDADDDLRALVHRRALSGARPARDEDGVPREAVTLREVLDCVLIDEAQFLTALQVDQLMEIALIDDVPVLAYGIRTDFRTVSFPGSRRLLEIAHSLEELKTICRCGRKAIFNARKVGESFVFDGDQVAIDSGDVTYESLCGQCYLAAGGRLPGRTGEVKIGKQQEQGLGENRIESKLGLSKHIYGAELEMQRWILDRTIEFIRNVEQKISITFAALGLFVGAGVSGGVLSTYVQTALRSPCDHLAGLILLAILLVLLTIDVFLFLQIMKARLSGPFIRSGIYFEGILNYDVDELEQRLSEGVSRADMAQQVRKNAEICNRKFKIYNYCMLCVGLSFLVMFLFVLVFTLNW